MKRDDADLLAQDIELLDAYSRTVIQTLERTRGGVVSLRMHARRGPRAVEGAGSGFLITPDGYLLTNHHVADAGDPIVVTLDDGSERGPRRACMRSDTTPPRVRSSVWITVRE